MLFRSLIEFDKFGNDAIVDGLHGDAFGWISIRSVRERALKARDAMVQPCAALRSRFGRQMLEARHPTCRPGTPNGVAISRHYLKLLSEFGLAMDFHKRQPQNCLPGEGRGLILVE